MDLFRSLSDAELDACIKDLALQIASGTTQISSNESGSAGYMTLGEGIRLMKAMERSRSKRLGLPTDSGDRIRYTRVITRNDYWQR